jgi:hypothetical protein
LFLYLCSLLFWLCSARLLSLVLCSVGVCSFCLLDRPGCLSSLLLPLLCLLFWVLSCSGVGMMFDLLFLSAVSFVSLFFFPVFYCSVVLAILLYCLSRFSLLCFSLLLMIILLFLLCSLGRCGVRLGGLCSIAGQLILAVSSLVHLSGLFASCYVLCVFNFCVGVRRVHCLTYANCLFAIFFSLCSLPFSSVSAFCLLVFSSLLFLPLLSRFRFCFLFGEIGEISLEL